ncbi:MAG: hypothetical protein ACFCU1_10380 [Sumerlaeia bacterium]
MKVFFSLALCFVFLLSGCSHYVRFAPHAPYSTSNKINAPLLIITPDHAEQVRYTSKQSKLYYFNKYHIYYGQAMKIQASARLDRKVERLFIMSDSEYSFLRGVEPEGLEFVHVQEQKEFRPITPEQLKESISFVPEVLTQDEGYMLIIHKVQFAFIAGAGQYIMDVSFRDRSTNKEIFQGIFRGSGKPMRGADSAYNYKIQINEAVSSAFANAFSTIEKEIDKSLAAQQF